MPTSTQTPVASHFPAPTATASARTAVRERTSARPYGRYIAFFLALTIGSVWGLSLLYLFAYDFALAVLGPLELLNPVVILILHSPAIAALLIYAHYDGWRGLANFMRTLVPRRRDLVWIPVLMAVMFAYIHAVRYVGMAFGIEVPDEPLAPGAMLLKFVSLFVMEIGMVAIAIGWYGFFLPIMQRATGSRVLAGIATGVGIGVFVAPGNLFSSFELATAWPLYVAQLCVLSVGMSLLLDRMKGNVLFFLLPFWVSASGSHFNLYVFNMPTQLVQITLFSALVLALFVVLHVRGRGRLDPPAVFPEFVEHRYTTAVGAVFPGIGNRSAEGPRPGRITGTGERGLPVSEGVTA